MARRSLRFLLAGAAFLGAAGPAWSYIGPGAGFAFLGSVIGLVSAILAGILGLILMPFRIFVRRSFVRGAVLMALVLAYAVFLIKHAGVQHHAGTSASKPKIIVLGFDGMDPNLVEKFWTAGRLLNMKRLAGRQGLFRLGTTTPPASPVAWSTFSTGLDPEEHGIMDFLVFDPQNKNLEFSMAKVSPSTKNLRLARWQFPMGGPEIISLRKGATFWRRIYESHVPAVVLRVPVTFPPEGITRMLSGMGVPDLRGTQGMFSFYTTRIEDAPVDAGESIKITLQNHAFRASISGPPSPYRVSEIPSQIPFEGKVVEEDRSVLLDIQGRRLRLKEGQWSDFVPVVFKLGFISCAEGLVKFYLKSVSPELELYLSPVQMDPREPAMPISYPENYSGELARDIGLYNAGGMPEETWGLNAGILTDEAFLKQAWGVLEENRKMYELEFSRLQSGLLVFVFVSPDRISHMFWRTIDPEHRLYSTVESDTAASAVRDVYDRMDEIVGWTLDRMDSGTHLIVLSDHGFTSFRRVVHLNSLLRDAGFLMCEDYSKTTGAELFENVDWSRTRAFAAGLNGLYLNTRGRTGGIVPEDQVASLKKEIHAVLTSVVDPVTGKKPIRRLFDGAGHGWPGVERDREVNRSTAADGPDLIVGYESGYRASRQTALGAMPQETFEDNLKKWSGDHLVDPDLVPGILLTDLAVTVSDPGLRDLAPSLIHLLGNPQMGGLKGRTILAWR